MDQIAIKPARACWVETQITDPTRKEKISGDYPVKIGRVVFDGSEFSASTFADGKTTKRWKVGAITVASANIEGHEEAYVDSIHNFSSTPSTRARFAGMEWISLANCRGIASLGGVACWHFDSLVARGNGPVASGRKAWIDTTTGLPVARSENGVQIGYHFEAAPSGPVPYTPVVQDFVKRYREKMARYCPGG
ncbi:MAG: hypothetical protein ACFUZC_17285 [Chthoniobacteraceae bacterium]